MSQIVETCRSCGSRELDWRRDAGWLTRSWRWLRCRNCGDSVRLSVPPWTLALYGIAGTIGLIEGALARGDVTA